MLFTIKDGKTPNSGVDLCQTCTSSHIWDDGTGHHKRCTADGRGTPIHGPVSFCSEFMEAGKTKYDYEKIAWILEVKKGQVVGFIGPQDKKKHRELEDL